MDANSMTCDTPQALRFFASARAGHAANEWMRKAADEIERLRLTDAERAAIKNAIGWIESPSVESEAMPEDYLPITNALRGLLARLGTKGSE